jgi:hypothetical protein
MSKIWEVHYTYFSGDTALDTVGTQHLTHSRDGIFPIIQDPLPLFSTRKGIRALKGDSVGTQERNYELVLSGATNGRFKTSLYNYRSFVLWVYKSGSAEQYSYGCNIWADGESTRPYSGIACYQNNLRIKINYSTVSDTYWSNGWHMVTVCVDRFGSVTKAYLDTTEILDTSSIPSGNYDDTIIGTSNYSGEPHVYIAKTTTYDHFLSSTEIQYLYDTFLFDTNDPVNFPYASVSGVVFDTTGTPLSTAEVVAYNLASKEIVAYDTTNMQGQYTLNFETSGQYSISAAKLGINGGRVLQATVSGGKVEFDSY